MQGTGGVRLVHGFEEAVRAGVAMMERPGGLIDMAPPPLIEEFVDVLAPIMEAKRKAGTSFRFLSVGPPPASLARDLRAAGGEVRWIDERREIGVLAADDELMLFPTVIEASGPFREWVMFVRDPPAVALVRLGVEKAWDRASPVP